MCTFLTVIVHLHSKDHLCITESICQKHCYYTDSQNNQCKRANYSQKEFNHFFILSLPVIEFFSKHLYTKLPIRTFPQTTTEPSCEGF